MNYRWLLAVLFVAVIIALAACTPSNPPCTPEELIPPVPVWPEMWDTVYSTTPTLFWDYASLMYPYPYPDYYCVPTGYELILRTGPFFTDNLGATIAGGESDRWTVPAPLTPGTEYGWLISARSGDAIGPPAGYLYFFVGPMCATADLAAPTLLEPANNATVTEIWPSLIWDYPDPCLPEGYRIELSTESDLSDVGLHGGTGNPSTRWAAGHELENCERYYWRVAPINDTTLGPFSSTFTFRIDTDGTCPPEPFIPDFGGWFEMDMNAFCRVGPDPVFDPLGDAIPGDRLPADGCNPERTWVRVKLADGTICWVAMFTGKLDRDCNELNQPEIPIRPTPRPDSDGPAFGKITFDPSPVYYYPLTACGPTTTTVQVEVSDPSGVSYVNLFWRVVGSQTSSPWMTTSMSPTGTGLWYSATIDVLGVSQQYIKVGNGSLEVQVYAVDTLKNEAYGPSSSISLMYCR